MYVIPAAGRSVPDPYRNDTLPAEGREVEANQYWFRKIEDGDVAEGTRPADPEPEAPATSKKR